MIWINAHVRFLSAFLRTLLLLLSREYSENPSLPRTPDSRSALLSLPECLHSLKLAQVRHQRLPHGPTSKRAPTPPAANSQIEQLTPALPSQCLILANSGRSFTLGLQIQTKIQTYHRTPNLNLHPHLALALIRAPSRNFASLAFCSAFAWTISKTTSKSHASVHANAVRTERKAQENSRVSEREKETELGGDFVDGGGKLRWDENNWTQVMQFGEIAITRLALAGLGTPRHRKGAL